jgi:hypothetical protein
VILGVLRRTGATVVLATHHVMYLERCDRVLFMDAGDVIGPDRCDALAAQSEAFRRFRGSQRAVSKWRGRKAKPSEAAAVVRTMSPAVEENEEEDEEDDDDHDEEEGEEEEDEEEEKGGGDETGADKVGHDVASGGEGNGSVAVVMQQSAVQADDSRKPQSGSENDSHAQAEESVSASSSKGTRQKPRQLPRISLFASDEPAQPGPRPSFDVRVNNRVTADVKKDSAAAAASAGVLDAVSLCHPIVTLDSSCTSILALLIKFVCLAVSQHVHLNG